MLNTQPRRRTPGQGGTSPRGEVVARTATRSRRRRLSLASRLVDRVADVRVGGRVPAAAELRLGGGDAEHHEPDSEQGEGPGLPAAGGRKRRSTLLLRHGRGAED